MDRQWNDSALFAYNRLFDFFGNFVHLFACRKDINQHIFDAEYTMNFRTKVILWFTCDRKKFMYYDDQQNHPLREIWSDSHQWVWYSPTKKKTRQVCSVTRRKKIIIILITTRNTTTGFVKKPSLYVVHDWHDFSSSQTVTDKNNRHLTSILTLKWEYLSSTTLKYIVIDNERKSQKDIRLQFYFSIVYFFPRLRLSILVICVGHWTLNSSRVMDDWSSKNYLPFFFFLLFFA